MAENVYLFLKLNGKDIQGESSQHSLGRENSIECVQFVQQVKTARETGAGAPTGRRQYDPIVVVKPIDKSSPLLVKGLVQNQVAEGVFKFFRPSPTGDGTTEQFFRIEIKEGRIAAVKEYVLDTLDPEIATRPPLEEVSFVFGKISWTHAESGASFEDSVTGR
jgi:type VI secretion system secreted protein Hcp